MTYLRLGSMDINESVHTRKILVVVAVAMCEWPLIPIMCRFGFMNRIEQTNFFDFVAAFLLVVMNNWNETLGFGLSDNFYFWGGYSETLGFGLCDNFHWGGVFWNSRIWTLWQFLLGGVFWNSRIWTLAIFIGGGGGVFWNSLIWTLWQFSFWGVFWNSQIWTLWQFSFWGGYSVFQNRGILPEFGPKFQPLQQAHASQIVSHILRMWRVMTKNLFSLVVLCYHWQIQRGTREVRTSPVQFLSFLCSFRQTFCQIWG